ncbi:Down syndrome cell adhesion molecule-like protein Dscam2 [Limulus polyphemus]|uniref:Down syndrome cell adhesion molecule-like protein Dscam2 n=1 Tax=Limulus polyphemus TaxID=6850 RepID=A0ABM1TQF1_LIMPO|nr:Down syndrome cell adhesion molecule-like protein Dscam2 [Limulus polyphemus]
MRTEIVIAVLLLVHHSIEKVSRKDEIQPPAFITEPPSQVTFLNSSGEGVSCLVTRSPSTVVTWTKTDGSSVVDIPGVLYVRSDGALFFPPFHPGDYRPEVHNAIYRCVASNIIGSVGSRNVRVRAVVPELYQVGVFDSFVTTGNTAVIRCHVPTGTRHYVTVSAWLSDDRHAILPTADPNFGKKYLAFPTGELHIHNVQDIDEKRRYKCQVKNILTGEKTESLSWAKLVLTKPSSTFPPRIQEENSVVEVHEREIAKLPCAAHGYPTPEYNWYHHDGHTLSPVILGSRVTQLHGTLILRDASIRDNGNYVCVTKNSQGQQRTERTLTVRAPLKVEINPGSPRVRFVKYGERVLLNCNVSGYPVETIFWVKDQRPLPVNYRVRQAPDHNLEISSFEKEDSGIYQCYAQNNRDSAQHFIALKLEEKPPTLTKHFTSNYLCLGSRYLSSV